MLGMLIIVSLGSFFLGRLSLQKKSRKIDLFIKSVKTEMNALTSRAHQLAATSESLSSSVSQEAASLHQTASATTELTEMVGKNIDAVGLSQTSAQASLEATFMGKQVVDEVIMAIQDIGQGSSVLISDLEATQKEFAGVLKVINDIQEKTHVINEIVFSTKLLSFNASVEAARAGEAGKGFAVVAEEIGNLAKMSGQSACEISEIIKESNLQVQNILSQAKKRADLLIQKNNQNIEAGMKVVKKCEGAFDQIIQNVSKTNEMSDNIAQASKEQATGIAEIHKAVAEMNQVTVQNERISKSTAELSKDILAKTNTLLHAVDGITPSPKNQGKASPKLRPAV